MMKKLLPFAAMSALAFVTACDNGGAAVDCTSDADCANEEVNTFCDISEGEETGVCIAPVDAQCEEDVDCDISDTGAGTNQYGLEDLDPASNSCEDEAAVTIVAFDGTELCAIESDNGDCSAAGGEAVDAEAKAGGTVEICVVGLNTCGDDQQCTRN